MALSYVNYPADGSTKQFAVTFGYLSRSHVFVFVDNNLTAFKWVSGTNIEIDPAPADGAEVRIQRLTDKVNRITDFSDGQTLLAEDLDAAALQNFYLAQEMLDGIVDGVLQGDVLINVPLVSGDPLTLQSVQGFIDEASRNSPVIETLLSDVGANTLAIAQEVADRAAAITAEANARQAALQAEADARLADVTALQAQIDADVSNLAQLSTELTNEVTARQAAVQANADALAQEALDRQSGDSALQTQVNAVVATANSNAALIATEQQARIDGDDALASQLTVVSAAANRVRTFRQTAAPTTGMEEGDLWFDTDDGNKAYRFDGTSWVQTDDTRIADALSQIATETTARVDGDNALASQITSLTTQVDGNAADIVSANEAISNESSARATAINGLQTQVDAANANIASNATAISNESSARATAIDGLVARFDRTAGGRVTLDDGPDAFTITPNGAPETGSDIGVHWDFVPVSGQGTVARLQPENQGFVEVFPRAVFSATGGKRFRLRVRVRVIEDATNGGGTQVGLRFRALNESYQTSTYLGTVTFNHLAAADGWQVVSTEVEINEADPYSYLRANLYVNWRYDLSINGNARYEIGEFEVEEIADTVARITTESDARAAADSALASDISGLTTRMGTAEADIVSNQTAIADETSARTTAISNLQTQIDGNSSSITLVDETLTSSLNALSRRQEAFSAEFAASLALVLSEVEARADEDESLSTRIDVVSAETDGNAAAIVAEQTARVDGDAANALSISTVATDLGTTNTTVGNLQSAQSTFEAATARDLQFQLASLAGVLAGALSEIETRATENEAVVTSIDELSVNLENNYATITTVQQVEATANDAQTRASAIYGVRSDVNGYVTGFGLSNDGAEGEFAVMADRFLVVDPASATSGEGVQAFVVQNGSLYVNSAFIANLHANVITAGTFAAERLASASVEARHIKADEVWTSRLYLGNNDLSLDGSTGTLRYTNDGSTLVEIGALTGGGAGVVVKSKAGVPVFRALADGTTEIDGAFIKTATIDWAAITNVVIQEADIGDAEIGAIKLKSGAIGAMVSASTALHDLYTGVSDTPQLPAEFEELELATPFIEVEEGELVRVTVSYEIEAEYDSFEWFLFRDKVELRGSGDGGATDFFLQATNWREMYVGRASNSAPQISNPHVSYADPFTVKVSYIAPATGPSLQPVTDLQAVLKVYPFAPAGNSECRYGGTRTHRIKDTLQITNAVIELEKFSSGFTVS